MNAENCKLITPKQTKRLGLARSCMLKRSATSSLTGSIEKCGKLDTDTPTTTPKSRLPHSDIKMNYRCFEQKPSSKTTDEDENTLTTPKNSSSAKLDALAASTNCRPYRLALSKKVKCGKLDTDTPTSTHKSRLPHSDIKMNYRCLEQKPSSKTTDEDENTLTTPKNSSSAELHALTASTNCRPYRLALSKKVREKMSKKRLEFYLAKEMEKEETEQTESEYQNFKTGKSFEPREELVNGSTLKKATAEQDHLKKVEELKQAIFIWKTGFSAALHDLQQKIEPRLETTAVLERLNIPQEMIKYIDD